LWTPDFNQPMRNSMLWVYEGQTHFWGFVLAARSGLTTAQQAMDVIARFAAAHGTAPGRSWRPLLDTGNDSIITRYLVDVPSPSWHRTLGATYEEANLIWLEADGIIRELSGERRSMDDFARSFFAGGGERPSLYGFDDVVASLKRVQPYDWSSFLKVRIEATAPPAPSEWLKRSGYQLVFTETPTETFTGYERRFNHVDLSHSVGLFMAAGSGKVTEVVWDSAAYRAGITAGATIMSVNGRDYDAGQLKAAIQANKGGGSPLDLVVRNRNRVETVRIDYRGGLRYPRLDRLSQVPDRLGELLKPLP
jgi:predicted metalloprotease with PDZ domain